MVQTIEAHAQSATDALGRDHIDPRVLAVMNQVPRHEFVSGWYENQAYEDRPLPIGHGQTISQPFIVALMTDLLRGRPGRRGARGRHRLGLSGRGARASGARRAHHRDHSGAGRSRRGAPRRAWATTTSAPTPATAITACRRRRRTTAIVVTAAAQQVPPALIQQLKPGGIMVIPVGGGFALQHLMLVEKDADGPGAHAPDLAGRGSCRSPADRSAVAQARSQRSPRARGRAGHARSRGCRSEAGSAPTPAVGSLGHAPARGRPGLGRRARVRGAARALVLDHPVVSLRLHGDQHRAARLRRERHLPGAGARAPGSARVRARSPLSRRCSASPRSRASRSPSGCRSTRSS